MSKTKILVAAHKVAPVYSNDIYTPIHVGAANSKFELGYLKDSEGDNISKKNPNYCELTAQYWAWKNLSDCDYVGLCHYRRYFDLEITKDNVDDIFKKYDIILSQPFYRSTPLIYKMHQTLADEDVIILFYVINKLYPEYGKAVIDHLWGLKDVPYNMFVCSYELFSKFAQWQFSILSECEKYVKVSPYPNSKRIYGFMGEYLLPIYCLHNNLKVKYCHVVGMVGDKPAKSHNTIKSYMSRGFWKLANSHMQKPVSLEKIYHNSIYNFLVSAGWFSDEKQ